MWMAQGPLYGEIRSYMASKIEMILASLLVDTLAWAPISCSPVELATLIQVMDGSWFHPSPLLMIIVNGLIMVPMQSSADNEFLHAHNPPFGTFHPWSCWDVLASVHGRACSFPLIHPRGVFLTWCRAGTRQSACCGNSSISLPSGVGSPRVKLVHLACVVCTLALSTSGVMRRSLLQWRIHDLPYSSFTMYKGTSFLAWCSTLYSMSSYWSLIFLFPWYKSAFTKTKLPGSNETALICLS